MAHQLFCHPPISQFLMTDIFISSMFCCINLRYCWPISNYFPSPDFIKKKRKKKKHTIWSVWQTIVMKLHNLVNGTGYLSELKKKKICMYEIPKPHANFITLTLGAEATYLERSKGFCSHLALFSLSQKKVASLLFLVSSVVFPSRPYFFSFFAFSS